MPANMFRGVSTELAQNMFYDPDTKIVYINSAWKRDVEVSSFVGLAKKRGAVDIEFLESDIFVQQSAVAKIATGETHHSDLQHEARKLFRRAFDAKSSDIHISDYGTHGVVKFRSLGMMHKVADLPGITAKQLIGVIYGTMSQQCTTSSHTPSVRQDARIARREFLPESVHSIRVHTEPIECSQAEGGVGCKMILRLLYDRTKAKGDMASRLKMLGYDDLAVEQFRYLSERTGLIIIAGPTGHGKSTLLKHVMEAQAHDSPEKSFLSVEDPPEYPLVGIDQIMVNTGSSSTDEAEMKQQYISALAGVLRSDLDSLMIGEIRYPEAATAAIDAALSGHTVWATLHANSAIGIIRRMMSRLEADGNSDPLEFLCDSSVTAGLIYQRLVPVLCPNCKLRIPDVKKEDLDVVLPEYVRNRLIRVINDMDNVFVRNRQGCPHCGSYGFVDQTVAAEIIVTDEAFLQHIRKGNIAAAHEHWITQLKGKSHIQDAIAKIEKGILDPFMTEKRIGVPLTYNIVGPKDW